MQDDCMGCKGLVLLLVIALLLAMTKACRADDAAAEWWGVWNTRSYHTDHTSRYQDHNYGPGIEYHPTKEVRFAAGYYENSLRRDSLYFGTMIVPFESFPATRSGLFVGMVTGYDKDRRQLLPAAGLVTVVEPKGLPGFNILTIPRTPRNPGVIGLEIKVPLPL